MKKLYRDSTNKVFTGLCAGIGNHFNFSIWGIRILFIIIALASRHVFLALLVYVIASIIVPAKNKNSFFESKSDDDYFIK